MTHGTVCLIIPSYASEFTSSTTHFRLATASTVQGTYSDGGEILSTRADELWDPPDLLYNGYGLIRGR